MVLASLLLMSVFCLVAVAVKDLVLGSRLGFEDRGVHQLESVYDHWQLLALTSVAD